ncbi:tape-measure chaperone [Caulobacter phage Seuss]|uniref:Tape-measure chaperone n=1 Tax=Caulobacter phage Seuss TaxID=1675601 RepID=A0A0K1LM05_9CAUD|nr:tail length tape measure protein chaperone [Caulobacter phage Seuss]AKU43547.1 tape-measure chaperone [Caulobacter phage Seuss]
MTDAAAELPPKPEDYLTITHNGEPRELFMSYLRKNSILRFVDNPTQIVWLSSEPDLIENVMRIMLSPKAGAGGMFEHELTEEEVSEDDVQRIMNWVQDHLTYFFMKRFQDMADRGKLLEPIAKDLLSSVGSSNSSTSETPSAGPSTPSPAA